MEASGTRLAALAGTTMKTWGYGYPLLWTREVGVFLLPAKAVDTARDDGDFDRKVALIEHVDAVTALLMNLEPDVLIVPGDHPTPSLLRYHSWHSAPVALWPEHSPADGGELSWRARLCGGRGRPTACVRRMPLTHGNVMQLDRVDA